MVLTPVVAAVSPVVAAVLAPVTSPADASCHDGRGTGDRSRSRDGSSTEHTPPTNTTST